MSPIRDFRVKILLIMIFNLVAIFSYDYFVVNGIRKRVAKKKREKRMAPGLAARSEAKVEEHAEKGDKIILRRSCG